MFVEKSFTKENLDACLKELGKEYRKRSGKKVPAEIILIGGAAILAKYGFRENTYDIDALIFASSVMKEAINSVGDRLGLPGNWLNMDFKETKSFSEKLLEISEHYRTFSNVLSIRTVSAEYLIAMKLMSGREYKFDLSDIAGVLLEHERSGNPISREDIDRAVLKLYGSWDDIPDASRAFYEEAFKSGDYEGAYIEIREHEKYSKKILLDFDRDSPGELKGESISAILEQARNKLQDRD